MTWTSGRRVTRNLCAFVAVGALSSACARVAPYERGTLAHPSMTMSDLAGPGEEHVRAVHEGAVGGGTSTGGGCGCN
jgi:hypothetical protein